MNAAKREALKNAGFRVGTVQEFLGLEDWENQIVELKYRLCKQAKSLRETHGLTQQAVAKTIGSSQSRVAKIEAGSPDVSLDLVIHLYYAVGGRLGESEHIALPKPPLKRVKTNGAAPRTRRKKAAPVS